MPRTIQCKKCGVVLNLPEHVSAGRRLKCPRCATRFVVSEADASSVSTIPGQTDAAITSFDMEKRPPSRDDLPKRPPSRDDLPSATSEGDLRDTFDLPLSTGSGRDAERGGAPAGPETADAAGLFADSGPSRRRPTAAEARAKARRCSHCGGGVPAGMSICPTCGTDQETGLRVGLEDDLIPPPPPRPLGPPLHVAIVGGMCGTAGIILTLAGLIQSTRGKSDLENYTWLVVALVSAFGIFACVQFLRGKTAKTFIIALTAGVVLNLILLIGYPLAKALMGAPEIVNVKPTDSDESDIIIPSWDDRIDYNKIYAGIGFLVVYAALSTYLTSPYVKKYIFRCRSDRGF
jgi:phage FluMu protein Com